MRCGERVSSRVARSLDFVASIAEELGGGQLYMKQGGQKARPSGSLSLVGCRCSELYQDGRVTLKTAVIPPILEGALGCGWAQKPRGHTTRIPVGTRKGW